MMSLRSLEAFLVWLKNLPDRHRKNVIHNIVQFMPNCEIDYSPEGGLREFESWLRVQSLHPAKEIGAAIAVKAILDFTIMDGITGASQWKEQAENVDTLIEKWSTDPDKENKIVWLQSHRESLEFNAAQAMKMKETWVDLCELHFTNAALKDSLLNREINF